MHSSLQIFAEEGHGNAYSDRTKEGLSIFGLLNRTKTPMGKLLLRHWLLRPSSELSVIRGRHDALECFTQAANGELPCVALRWARWKVTTSFRINLSSLSKRSSRREERYIAAQNHQRRKVQIFNLDVSPQGALPRTNCITWITDISHIVPLRFDYAGRLAAEPDGQTRAAHRWQGAALSRPSTQAETS